MDHDEIHPVGLEALEGLVDLGKAFGAPGGADLGGQKGLVARLHFGQQLADDGFRLTV